MAQFTYDESGGTSLYFLVSFYALVLFPVTYYLWPSKEKKDFHIMADDGGDAPDGKDKEFSLGPFADAQGITHDDLTDPRPGKLTTIKIGIVMELFDNIPSNNAKDTAALLLRLAHPNSRIHDSDPNSLRKKIGLQVKNRSKLKRNKKASLPTFLDKEFVPPVTPLPPPPPPPPSKRTYDELEAENQQMRVELRQMEEEHRQVEVDLNETIQTAQKVSEELSDVVKSHEKSLTEHSKDLKKLTQEKERLQRLYSSKASELDKVNLRIHTLREKSNTKTNKIKALKKTVKRDKDGSEKKLKVIHTLRENCTDLQKQVTDKDEHIQVTTARLETAQNERRAALKELSQVKRRACKSKFSLVAQNETKIQDLKKKVRQSDARIHELEHLNELLEHDIIQTFENGRFVNELRETVMVLLTDCNVSMAKVPKVINTVCQNLVGVLPERLPSQGSYHRILHEAKFVAQVQIADAMSDADPGHLVGNTIHSDATTKFHKHYQGFQVTLKDGSQMTIGMSEVGAGDTATYMDAFNTTITNIAKAVSENDEDTDKKIAELVTSLKNTMGDQGPTNPQFNNQLATLREELLPQVIEDWDDLSKASQQEIASMGNFFCKMHLLVNFATEADKILKINEADVIAAGRNPFAFGSESGACRLIRTAAKALTHHGCDKSGVAADWETYLAGIGKTNQIITFRGNRFNVLFYDAAATYYHRTHIYEFLSALPDPNNLLKAVNFDIQQRLYLAQIRALGIVDKIITGPLWRVIESHESILDLNDPLNHMLGKIRTWATDSSPLLKGEILFQDTEVHKDCLYDELFKETGDAEFDTYTQLALEMIIAGIILILERQAKDQLEGGRFFAPTEQQKLSAKNVPTTNNVSERDFGVLDILVRIKPAATDHAYETYIMWLHNKTSKWLDEMNIDEKTSLLNKARHRYPQIREQYLAKKDTVKRQHVASLKAKLQRKEQKDGRARAAEIVATEGIIGLGGVWTEDTIDHEYEKLPEKEQKQALWAQIAYHKKVLNAKGHARLFYKSSNNVQFTIQQLFTNLKTILEINNINADSVPLDKIKYHTKESVSTNAKTSKSEVMARIRNQRNGIIAKQQQHILPTFLQSPQDLVGKHVKHKCKEEDGTVEWSEGQVTAMCRPKANAQPIKTEYEIVYDAFPEDTWCFPLLTDISNGDLILL